MRRHSKSLWSYNPIPNDTVMFQPFWHPDLSGAVFNSVDSYERTSTVIGAVQGAQGRTFDATDDSIVVPASASLTFGTGNWSWLTWVSMPRANNKFILGKGGVGDYAWRAEVEAGATRLYFKGEASFVSANALFDASAFTFIAAVRVGNDCLFYRSGALFSTSVGALTTGNDDTNTDLFIGSRTGTSNALDGTMGELLMYNRALIADEILYIYNQTKGRYI